MTTTNANATRRPRLRERLHTEMRTLRAQGLGNGFLRGFAWAEARMMKTAYLRAELERLDRHFADPDLALIREEVQHILTIRAERSA